MSRNFNDEFNNNSVTNDRDVLKNEYSQNKDAEFSSHKNNSLPKDEFSSKNNSSTHRLNNENLNKITEKAVESGGEVVTVSSSATASSIAASTSTIAVAASTVAVVAIGTVTGISVALHNYDYKFNVFSVSANELTYELYISDSNQEEEMLSYEDFENEKEKEKQLFNLRVYNNTYDYTHPLWLGNNYNTFSGLTLGQTYNIVLSESRYGGETLFASTFTTKEITNFRGFSIPGTADFYEKTFDVELDYVDSTDSFSDFTLYLEDAEYPEEVSIIYALDPKPGKQAVKVSNPDGEELDLHRTYNYKFFYKDKGETINYSEGQVSFTDTSGKVRTFNSLSIDKVVDFDGTSFNVTLDYDDPLEEYYSFYLNMETTSNAYLTNSVAFYLDNTTDEQSVNVDGYGFDFNENYDYSLVVYTYDGEETLETGTISFQDISGRQSQFNQFIFDKTANFRSGEVSFQLDYVDDFNYFDNFVVTFINKDDGSEIPIELDKTTDPQPKPAMEYDLSFEYNYTYKLTANYKRTEITLVEDLEPFIFEDNVQADSDLYGLMFIGGEAKYSDRSFDVALSYADDFDCLENFVLTLYDEENDDSINIELSETTDEQTVFANETKTGDSGSDLVYKVDIVSHHITYNVSCQKDNSGTFETITLFDEPQAVTFSNSEFRSFDYTTALYRENEEDYYTMGMKFDYIDENDEHYADWHVALKDTDDLSYLAETWYTSDDYPREWTYKQLIPLGDQSVVDAVIGDYCDLVVEVNIYDSTTGVSTLNVEVYRYENIKLTLSSDATPHIYGLFIEPYFTSGLYELSARAIVFEGDPDMFTDVQMTIETQDGAVYTYNIDPTYDSFVIYLSQPVEDSFDEMIFEEQIEGKPVVVRIKYRYYIASDSGSGTTGDPDYELSDLQEIICYTDLLIEIGH